MSISRTSDGKGWRVMVSAGVRPDGSRYRPSRVVRGTYKDAQRVEAQMRLENRHGGSPMRLREWAAKWLRDCCGHRAATTTRKYQQMLDGRILPALGNYRLDEIQPRHVHRFLMLLAGESITRNTQLKHYRLLSLLLKDAVYAGYLHDNPARQVQPPRLERHRASYLQAADAGAVWQALQHEPLIWRAIIGCALFLGLRRGELVALRWQDVDAVRGEVYIRRSAYKLAGEPQAVKEPKTTTSRRIISLPAPLAEVLAEWRREQAGTDADYICAWEPGGWMGVDMPTRWFNEFIARHGLPPITLHGLRHTAATLLLEAGIPVRAVSEHLGHSLASTTVNIYAHATDRAMNAAAEVLAKIATATGEVTGKVNGEVTTAHETAHECAITPENE